MLEWIQDLPGAQTIIPGIILILVNLFVSIMTGVSRTRKVAYIKSLQEVNIGHSHTKKMSELIDLKVENLILTDRKNQAIIRLVRDISILLVLLAVAVITTIVTSNADVLTSDIPGNITTFFIIHYVLCCIMIPFVQVKIFLEYTTNVTTPYNIELISSIKKTFIYFFDIRKALKSGKTYKQYTRDTIIFPETNKPIREILMGIYFVVAFIALSSYYLYITLKGSMNTFLETFPGYDEFVLDLQNNPIYISNWYLVVGFLTVTIIFGSFDRQANKLHTEDS